MTKWYLSKTNWFNAIMTLIAIATGLQGAFPKYAGAITIVILIGNAILRNFFTSTPIVA